ncbi:MAG: L,D-transpeptidase, partial [Bdellovibrionales bacterium]
MKFSCLFTVLAISIVGQLSHAAIREVRFPFANQVAAGTVVIRASERALYFVEDSQTALRYPIAVPKTGKEWSGATRVQ